MQDAPADAADGQAPWVVASGVIYAEDITDDSPYLFSELPGRFTGSYSGYNQDPLYVSVRLFSQSLLLSILLQVVTVRLPQGLLHHGHDRGISPLGLCDSTCAQPAIQRRCMENFHLQE